MTHDMEQVKMENIKMRDTAKLVKYLDTSKANNTSLLSLIIPPKDDIGRVNKMLVHESGKASNIKSRVNRQSVQSAISSVMQRLKLYNKVPRNGLAIYCGTIVTEEGKEKTINIDFEPHKPLNSSGYFCDKTFHTEALSALLSAGEKYGFIIMDGHGTLFGTLQGDTREVLHKFTVDLPRKHGRGGQSALRFSRLRMEKRHNYVRKVAEAAVQNFISNDKANISGLILAGSADFKTELSQSDLLDSRLQSKVLKVIDVAYGGENGFHQAIDLAAEALANVRFVQEAKLLDNYFREINKNTGKYCYGVDDTLQALECGAVDTLICWENLEVFRCTLRNRQTGEDKILHLTPDELDKKVLTEKNNEVDLELVDSAPLLEWLEDNCMNFGCTLEIVTDQSTEGSQFVHGFGGLGGILRYLVDFQQLADLEEDFNDIDVDGYMEMIRDFAEEERARRRQ